MDDHAGRKSTCRRGRGNGNEGIFLELPKVKAI